MLKVGLTGSIAVGKSFVLETFRELGCYVLDADKTAREVVEPGSAGLRRVVAEFGEGVLTTDRKLDRKKLAAIVFNDEGTSIYAKDVSLFCEPVGRGTECPLTVPWQYE